MTQDAQSKRKRIRLRIIMSVFFLIFSIGAILLFLLMTSIRTAPLQLGTNRTPESAAESTPEVTTEVTETIPLGTPPDTITFLSNRDGTWDIYRLDADGTLTNLTTEGDGSAAGDYFASWSMDSGQLNFLSTRTGEMGPTQIAPDGSGTRSLDILGAIMAVVRDGRFDWDPAWSPGGEQLVWASARDLNLEIYIIDTDGEFIPDNATRLTFDSGRDWYAAWSPDGQTITFSTDRNGSEDIYSVDITSGELTRLTDSTWDDIYSVWSLDGAQILYVHDIEHRLLEGILTLWVMNADGTEKRELGAGDIFIGDPTWSRDGEDVLYMSNESGHWHLYIMNADGSNRRRLTEGDSDNLFPAWRP